MNSKKLSIIMPVYNEARTVGDAVSNILAVDFGMDYELIIIDDGSKDGSSEIIRSLSANKKIVPIFNKDNNGKGHAVNAGLKKASGDIMIIMDADLEYSAEDILKVIQPIKKGGCQACYGTRFLGKRNKPWKYLRHFLGNKIITQIFNFIFESDLTDVETCLKAFSRSVKDKLALRQNDFSIDLELSSQIIKNGYKIIEVPIGYKPRGLDEGKKITYKDGIKALFYLASEFFKKLFKNPLTYVLISIAAIYVHNLGARGLWQDEAWVASSVLSKTISAMVNFNNPIQSTPVLFLLIERFFIKVFGFNDAAFRILPALFAIGSVLLIYLVMKIVTGNKNMSLLAALALACNIIFLRYAGELKQYTADIFCLLLIFYLSQRCIKYKTTLSWVFLSLASILALFLSYISIIAIIAAVLVIFFDQIKFIFNKDSKEKANQIFLFADYLVLIAGTFTVVYLAFMQKLHESQFLNGYWHGQMLSHPTIVSSAIFAYNGTKDLFSYLITYNIFPAIVPIFVGIFVIIAFILAAFYKEKIIFFYPLIIFLESIALGIISMYPFGGVRTCMYLLPVILMLFSYGLIKSITLVYGLLPKHIEILKRTDIDKIVFIFIIIFCVIGIVSVAQFNVRNYGTEEIKGPLEKYFLNRLPGDITYIAPTAAWAFEYYNTYFNYHVPGVSQNDGSETEIFEGTSQLNNAQFMADINSRCLKRIWIVLRTSDWPEYENLSILKPAIKSKCSITQEYDDVNAAVMLLDCCTKT